MQFHCLIQGLTQKPKSVFKSLLKSSLIGGFGTVFCFGLLVVLSPCAEAGILNQEALVLKVADKKQDKFSFSFFSIASVNSMKPGKTSPNKVTDRMVDSYEYFSINYKLDDVSKVALHVPLIMTTEGINEYGDNKPAKISMSDIHFTYANYDLGYIDDFDLSGNIKLYLPTSSYSQASRTIAKLRFEFFMGWQIARSASLEYVIKPDIYFQSQTAYYNPDDIPSFEDGTFMRDPRSTNKQFSLEHFAQVNIDINRLFTLAPKTGFVEDWYYSSDAEQLEGGHVTKFRAGVGLVVSPFPRVNFTFGIQNDSIISGNKNGDTVFFQPENTQYSVMTNAFLF